MDCNRIMLSPDETDRVPSKERHRLHTPGQKSLELWIQLDQARSKKFILQKGFTICVIFLVTTLVDNTLYYTRD